MPRFEYCYKSDLTQGMRQIVFQSTSSQQVAIDYIVYSSQSGDEAAGNTVALDADALMLSGVVDTDMTGDSDAKVSLHLGAKMSMDFNGLFLSPLEPLVMTYHLYRHSNISDV
jgi:hypothetical protein